MKDSTLQVFDERSGRELIQVLLSSSAVVLSAGKPAVLSATPVELADVSVEAPGVTLKAKRALVQKDGPLLAVDVP